MWNKQFIRASITERQDLYILTIKYNWYWLSEFEEVFFCDTMEQAKTKLLSERTSDHLDVIDKHGVTKNLTIL